MFQQLIESYANLIVGKSITEVLSSTSSSIVKIFDTMPSVKLEKGETIRSRSATTFKK